MQIKAKKFFIFLLSLCFCTTCCPCLFSQDKSSDFIITTRHLTPKEGLAGKQVNCGLQDSKGFTWFGTTHGLQRYDGKNFKLFTPEKNGLRVVKIAEDQNHLLWIMYGASGTDEYGIGKIDVLNLDNYTQQTVSQSFGSSLPFKEENINMIKANEKNELLISVTDSPGFDVLWLYSKAGGFKKIAAGIVNDPRNRFYFKAGRLMYYSDGTTITMISDYKKPILFQWQIKQNFQYIPLGIGADGAYFMASAGRFRQPGLKMHPLVITQVMSDGRVSEIPNQFSKDDESIMDETISGSFNDTKTSDIIIAHDKKGIFLFNGKKYFLLIDSTMLKGKGYPHIYDYFTTGTDQHWLCTSEGVIEIVVKSNHFTHLLSSDVIKFAQAINHQSRSIYADSSGIYATCWDGFYRISGNDAGNYNYKRIADVAIIGEGDGFYFDGKYFWMSGPRTWISRINVPENETRLYQTQSEHVWTGIHTREGKMLIGTPDKLAVLENDTLKVLHSCSYDSNYHSWFYQIFYSRDGKLWAISSKGLWEIKNGCIIAQYSAEAVDKKLRIPFTDLHCVLEDKSENFWMATNGAGLIKWNRKENTYQQFTVADGLSSNILYGVLEDEHGLFWISSEYGLMRFDPVSHFVKTYTGGDGLTSDEFNRVSFFKATDGRMFFGGLNGINAFYPKEFTGDSSQLNIPLRLVSFNQFVGDNDKLLDKTNDLLQQNIITLNPGDKFFTLEFQLLDFEEGKHRYAYMIEGIDKDWNYVSENSIRISGLPYGNFKLRIRGQNFEGAWSKNELNIPISVITPFYKTGWFYFIIVCCLAGLIYASMHFRTRTLQKANARLEAIVGKRTLQLQDSLNQKDVLLKEIHHRVKNNLQIISSMLELQAANTEDDLLKQALVEGQTRVGSIALIHHRLYENENLGEIEFDGFLKDLYKQVAAVFQKEGQRAEVFYDVRETTFDIDTIVPLGLLVNELFTNSFKYAFNDDGPGKIWLQMAETQKRNFIFTYKDSGPGLPDNFDIQKASSLGLRLIYRLGKQLGGNVLYDREKNIFTIKFKDSLTRKQDE